jgi:hypothetical protein
MNPVIQIEQEYQRVQSKQARPIRDFTGILDFRILLDPVRHLFVAGSGRYKFLEFRGVDFGESEKDLIHRTIEMVIPGLTGKLGPTLI